MLSAFVDHYTVTDIEPLIPLITKNIRLNFGDNMPSQCITITSLDWIALQAAPEPVRRKAFKYDDLDCLLVVDCIYHPSLLPALVETIDYLTIPNRTTALILMELRAEDVTREFLSLLLSKPFWVVHRLPGLGLPYALWAGFKS